MVTCDLQSLNYLYFSTFVYVNTFIPSNYLKLSDQSFARLLFVLFDLTRPSFVDWFYQTVVFIAAIV